MDVIFMNNLDFPKKYFITTPIYYVSGKFHLGHAYTTIVADVFARYYRLLGSDVFYLTGTDEHGLKVQKSAEENNKPVKEFIDDLVDYAKKVWTDLDISYDYFIRTTDKKHIENVQEIASFFFKKGDVYKGKYKGYYCKGCESFYTDKDISKDKCPIGHPVILEEEEAYFFKLSKYQDWLLEYIENNPSFITPESNKNEMVSFIKKGLDDLCISRKNVSWGIKLPFDQEYTIYVWLDALFNYYTALGGKDSDNYKKYWPPDFQLLGRDISKFHSIFWPIFLKSYDLKLPTTIFAHGWWLSEGQKMSKSFGNVVYPEEYVEKFGSDIFRYYILREMPFGDDGLFTKRTFVERVNSDLVSSIGNLLSRVVTLAEKRNKEGGFSFYKDSFSEDIENRIFIIHELYKKNEISKVINEILKISYTLNKYVQDNKPWELLKTDVDKFDKVIYNLLESLRILALELSPILTKKWKEMFDQLGLDESNVGHKRLAFTDIMVGKKVKKGTHLFTNIEIKE
jgi:methionyl-tRNA synthetase